MNGINKIAPGLVDAGDPLEGVATLRTAGAECFRSLAKAGYRTVIDPRTTIEDRGLDEEEGVGLGSENLNRRAPGHAGGHGVPS